MIDYLNKPGKELLLDLINDDNDATFTFDDLIFGPPVELSQNQDERNTACTVTASPASYWYGPVTTRFERLFLDRMFIDQEVEFSAKEVVSDATLLEAMNAEYGLQLEPTDVEIIGAYPGEFGSAALTVKAKPGSYVYLGEMVVQLIAEKIMLPNYITHTTLKGFQYPEALPGHVGKVVNSYTESLTLPGMDPSIVDHVFYEVGTNQEAIVGVGANMDGKVKWSNGGHEVDPDAKYMVLFELANPASLAEGAKLDSLYDFRLRIDGSREIEYKVVAEGEGYVLRENVAEDATPELDDIVLTVSESGLKLQALVDLVAIGGTIRSATAVAIRKVGFGPRVLGHFTLSAPQT